MSDRTPFPATQRNGGAPLLHDEHDHLAAHRRKVNIAVNGGFALLFAGLQIWPLVAAHLAGYLILDRSGDTPRLILKIWMVIFLQALLAVLLLGPDAGFQYYLVATIAPSFSSLQRPLWHKLLQGLAIVAFFILCDTWLARLVPYDELSPKLTAILRHFNILGFCGLLAWTAHGHARMVHESQAALHRIASTDTLTGLLNRRAFDALAEREAARSARNRRATSVVLCDIDHFKQVNDVHGHAAGDRVLQRVARVLGDALREYDSLARWGGEEFLMLLPDTDIAAAAQVAERLRRAVEDCAIDFDGRRIPVTLTLGASQLVALEDWHLAVKRADAALYRGKSGGRNRVETD